MSKKRVAKLKPGDRVKGKGKVVEVQDFGNRVVVLFAGGGSERYGAYDDVEVEG
jgi:hypothetical protein